MLKIKMQKTNAMLKVEHDFECAQILQKEVKITYRIIWDKIVS